MTEQTTPQVVRREVTVEASAEHAFDVFTARLDGWWPHSHHIGPAPAIAVVEPRVGGRMYSLAEDGTESDWGRVLVLDRPSRFAFAWQLTSQWGYEPDPAKASEVQVTFTPDGPDRTHVVLVHDGFERHADGGEGMRQQVADTGGWTVLLELYATAAAAPGGAA